MSEKLIGSFYFEKKENGDLVGQFTNNCTKEILCETSTFTNEVGGNQIFTTKWKDPEDCEADLFINRDGEKFKFVWKMKGKIEYKGEAFLKDKIYVGHYTGE